MPSEPQYIDTARRLIRGSERRKFDPFNRVNYQAKLSPDRWQFPASMLSLKHHAAFAELTDAQKWRLSLLEAVNFFSFNIHGEQALIVGMEPRLYRNKRAGEDPVSTDYLQRFIHEENSHSHMLAGYCIRYHGSLFPDRNVSAPSEPFSIAGQDVLYYGRIFILEYYLGHINKLAFDDEDIDRTARDIHRYHHSDEARHKAWDRAMVEENLRRLRAAEAHSEITQLRQLLDTYVTYVCAASVNPQCYRAIGLSNALDIRSEVLASADRAKQMRPWIASVRAYLDKIGLV